jgi:hypothetical protein
MGAGVDVRDMDEPGTRLTLVRAFARGADCYRVLAAAPDAGTPTGAAPAPGRAVAELRLSRQITLAGGAAYAITRRGGFFASERALWRGAAPVEGAPPLAILHHERRGLRWRYRVTLAERPERWLWLRRRGWLGGAASRDVVAVDAGREPAAADPLLLRVERQGTWRRHLRAEWLAPAELPLVVVVFLFSALVELDRRAAAAAASASGV